MGRDGRCYIHKVLRIIRDAESSLLDAIVWFDNWNLKNAAEAESRANFAPMIAKCSRVLEFY